MPLQKERPLFREKRLVAGEVHDNIVGFNIAEVRIKGARNLEGRGGPPKQIEPGFLGGAIADRIETRRDIRVEGELLLGIDAFNLRFGKRDRNRFWVLGSPG